MDKVIEFFKKLTSNVYFIAFLALCAAATVAYVGHRVMHGVNIEYKFVDKGSFRHWIAVATHFDGTRVVFVDSKNISEESIRFSGNIFYYKIDYVEPCTEPTKEYKCVNGKYSTGYIHGSYNFPKVLYNMDFLDGCKGLSQAETSALMFELGERNKEGLANGTVIRYKTGDIVPYTK